MRRIGYPAGDILLDGADACYDRDGPRILYSLGLDPKDRAFCVAHEFGHHKLHDLHLRCHADDFDTATPAEPESSVVGESDAYSPKQRTEAQANLFAREFLLPRDKLKAWLQGKPCDARKLADDLGLPLSMVLQQMADALLLPDAVASGPPKPPPPPPDASQARAASIPPGPFQLRAGPGTGKTRTLVARIKWLIEQGEDPATIVALSYSNDSAADLSDRLRREIGADAPAVWTGTFHAYGLELLRIHGEAIGLPPNPVTVDRSAALFELERLLPTLGLAYYLDLHEPLRPLKAVLNAISRAKDQLIGPSGYAELAEAMRATPETCEAGERALEVARIYQAYQTALAARGTVDFGDMIMRAHDLLDQHPEVRRTVRQGIQHLLVDEYQDMNRASALLLKQLVTPGKGPWVVGDVKQSIYRFRGASPVNMTAFATDFAGAKHDDLEVNYRSGGRIVRVFERFGGGMSCRGLAPQMVLTPRRGEQTGAVRFSLAATEAAEIEAIAQAIKQARRAGGSFRDHAVLARSHTTLARVAAHLERAGVPSLYFGDFFERDEVRDLLSLLSVASEREGIGLIRVAQLPPYGVAVRDILKIFAWRKLHDISMLQALRRSAEVDGLSPPGKAGLALLAQDLGNVGWTTTPHALIMEHLFCRDRISFGKIGGSGVAAEQARLAVYQLLQIAFEYRASAEGDPKGAFLAHVRRLEILDEEKEYRRLPTAAEAIDAVRLMTVHASKGLEFPHVHIAALSPYYFPSPNRHDPCPAPVGLIPSDPLMGKDAEEDGLFFVALSRAMDSLSLSRALYYQKRSSPNPSRLLEPIASLLPRTLAGTPDCADEGSAQPPFPLLEPATEMPAELPVRAIETYADCPRRYYYSIGLGLPDRARPSPYLGLISSVRATLAWARQTTDPAERSGQWSAQFDLHWQKLGPVDHAWSETYRLSGVRMIERAIAVTHGVNHPVERQITVDGQLITAKADNILESSGGFVIQRLKAARLAKTETAKTSYHALMAMVLKDHPGLKVTFRQVSLLDGEDRDATGKADAPGKSLDTIGRTLGDIRTGSFPPKTNDRLCPDCGFYFACPAQGILRPAT